MHQPCKLVLPLLLVSVVLGLAVLPALAEPFAGGDGARSLGGRPNLAGAQQQMFQKMGITPEQAAEIKALTQAGRQQSQALQQQLRSKQQALMQYLASPEATEAEARARAQEIHALQKQLSDLRLSTWFRMREKLTPEQLEHMSQMRQQHVERRGAGGRFGGQGGRRFQRPGGNF